jgi:hypothetical protein
MARIQQGYVASKTFRASFLKKWKLEDLHNYKQSAVFFGIYGKVVDRIKQMQAPAVLVWIGSDAIHALRNPELYKQVLFKPGVKHIVINESLGDMLRWGFGVKVEYLPITPMDYSAFGVRENYGQKVFGYAPKKNGYVYQRDLMLQLQYLLSKKGIEMLLLEDHNISHIEMPDIYAQCFCGVRLTVNDGLPNTIVEMGLMGMRTVCNVNWPSAIPWYSLGDVLSHIEYEYKHPMNNDSRQRCAGRVVDKLNIGEGWLEG